MNILDALKGVIKRMLAPKSIETVLHVQPAISLEMQNAIQLWEDMYMDKAPWKVNDVKSLCLPSMIASEKSRIATIEMNVKVVGNSNRAKYIKEQFDANLFSKIRKGLEWGIALGGFVIKPYVTMGVDNKYEIKFSIVKATDFYPISYLPSGDIKEAAFVDRVFSGDKVYSKVEYHRLDGTTLTIHNSCYEQKRTSLLTSGTELGDAVALSSVGAWADVPPIITIENMNMLLFAYFKMPQANTVDLTSPLGVSGFSKAIDLIRDADMQYSNLLWEFEGGQLAIDVDRTALLPTVDGKEVLPQLQQRLYRHSLDLSDDYAYNVFSPTLRDSNIINGLNTILEHIEDVCDLSRGTLSKIVYTEARTATELKIIKQRSYAANCEIQRALEDTLNCVFKIMDKYCDLYDIASGSFEINYAWDDSIITDKDSERQIDLIDVNNGLMSPIEYRIKWYGESEDTATESLKAIDELIKSRAKTTDMSNNNTDESDITTDEQDKQDKSNRAVDSNTFENKSK